MTKESNFHPIPGFPDYLVNDRGNVYSRHSEKFLVPTDTGTGLQVRILAPGGACRVGGCWSRNRCTRCRPSFTVQYLVLLTFVGEPPDYTVARHKDGEYLNNHLDNLYWGSIQQRNYANAQFKRKNHANKSRT